MSTFFPPREASAPVPASLVSPDQWRVHEPSPCERPAWLDNAHRDLDAAVAAAYGWPADISDDDAIARLFALNQARAAAG